MTDSGGTVYIVDDDEAIRSGLSMLLASFGYEPQTFSSGQDFLEHCEATLPARCVTILDLSMPLMDGLEVQAELQRRGVDVPVIFLSGDGDVPVAVSAVQRGAVDFMEKPVVTGVLLDRIEGAMKQRGSGGGGDDALEVTRSRLEDLTKRERDVLDGIASGKTSKDVAEDFGISERTVELHRSRVLRKMGARNATELLNRVLPALDKLKPRGS